MKRSILWLWVLVIANGCESLTAPADKVDDPDDLRAALSVSLAIMQQQGNTPGPGPGPSPGPVGEDCENCNGRGYLGDGTVQRTCPECNGTGKKTKSDEVSLSREPVGAAETAVDATAADPDGSPESAESIVAPDSWPERRSAIAALDGQVKQVKQSSTTTNELEVLTARLDAAEALMQEHQEAIKKVREACERLEALRGDPSVTRPADGVAQVEVRESKLTLWIHTEGATYRQMKADDLESVVRGAGWDFLVNDRPAGEPAELVVCTVKSCSKRHVVEAYVGHATRKSRMEYFYTFMTEQLERDKEKKPAVKAFEPTARSDSPPGPNKLLLVDPGITFTPPTSPIRSVIAPGQINVRAPLDRSKFQPTGPRRYGGYYDPDGYRSRWMYPGDIGDHLRSGHGVSPAGTDSKESLERLHDRLHDGGS